MRAFLSSSLKICYSDKEGLCVNDMVIAYDKSGKSLGFMTYVVKIYN